MDDIVQMNETKQASQPDNRTKRAAPFNIIGELGHKWFGILDAEAGERLEKRITDSCINHESWDKLIAEQTSIINLTKTY